jgi:hypothetical protein
LIIILTVLFHIVHTDTVKGRGFQLGEPPTNKTKEICDGDERNNAMRGIFFLLLIYLLIEGKVDAFLSSGQFTRFYSVSKTSIPQQLTSLHFRGRALFAKKKQNEAPLSKRLEVPEEMEGSDDDDEDTEIEYQDDDNGDDGQVTGGHRPVQYLDEKQVRKKEMNE